MTKPEPCPFDSAWPDDSGYFVLVDFKDEDAAVDAALFDRIDQTHGDALEKPEKIWLLRLADPPVFSLQVPVKWLDLNSIQGGIPRHVWAGIRIGAAGDLLQLEELLRVRTKRRFIELDIEIDTDELAQLLSPWRCTSCGTKGSGTQRDCPNTRLCDRDTLVPQIDWVINRDWHQRPTSLETPLLRKIALGRADVENKV